MQHRIPEASPLSAPEDVVQVLSVGSHRLDPSADPRPARRVVPERGLNRYGRPGPPPGGGEVPVEVPRSGTMLVERSASVVLA
jgi:hypothetical protein